MEFIFSLKTITKKKPKNKVKTQELSYCLSGSLLYKIGNPHSS